jgi:glucose/mannose transport system permease protein
MSAIATNPPIIGTARRSFNPWRILIYVVLLLFTIFYLLPVYILVITSLKSFTEVNLSHMWTLPQGFSLDSFHDAWFGSEAQTITGLAGSFLNSMELVIPATLITAFIGSLNGYVLAKWRFPGANVIFPLILYGMFIPYQAILIPLTRTLSAIHIFGFTLYGNLYGLILTHVIYGLPICTLIFRNYYAGVPTELVEAGRIDGAGFFGIYRHILFPISLPGFIVVIIWEFTAVWNEFLFAIYLVNNPNAQPITVALNNLAGSYSVQWNVQMAGAIIAALPPLLLYIFLSRYFVRGLLAGSVKG